MELFSKDTWFNPYPGPKGFDDRPYQSECQYNILQAYNRGVKKQLIVSPCGCHAPGQGILMYDGSIKKVEDITVGDQLMGPDSSPRNVLHLISSYTEEMYKITPVKGSSFIVNGDHILSLRKIGTIHAKRQEYGPPGSIINVRVKDYLAWSNNKKNLYKQYRASEISFPISKKQLPIDPYLLGLFLGDGYLKKQYITNLAPEIDKYLLEECFNNGIVFKKVDSSVEKDTRQHYRFVMRKSRVNLRDKLVELDLLNCQSHDKFIPSCYKSSSIEDRFKLLAGLLDTDGHYHNGFYDYLSKSEKLADDVAFIARSLGCAAYKHIRVLNTGPYKGNVYYRIGISGKAIEKIPIKIGYKKPLNRSINKDALHTGFSIEPSNPSQFYGFQLDGDNLYLLDDFTVTHNSGKGSLIFRTMQALELPTLLYMTHTEELVDQALEDARKFFPDLKIGLEKAEFRADDDCDIVVTCVPSLGRAASVKRLQRFNPNRFSIVYADECFVAGTKLDNISIEDIRVGDFTRSWNQLTGSIELKRVTHVFKTSPTALCELLVNGKKIITTPGHPFWDGEKWKPVIEFQIGDQVYAMQELSHNRRQEKTAVLTGKRLDDIKIYQQTDTESFRRLCPDGFVYNIEVEDNNNYFANGVLVHNCHHSVSKTNQSVINYFKPKLLLGATATVKRSDDIPLANVFDEVSFKRTLPELLLEGKIDTAYGPYLSDIIGKRIITSTSIADVSSMAGDFNEKELSVAVNNDDRNDKIIDAIERHAADRQCILVFAASTDHAVCLAEKLKNMGHAADYVLSTTKLDRRERIDKFRSGETRIMTSVGVFKEGLNVSRIDCVVLGKPTKSELVYQQCIGRLTRLSPGKTNGLILDVVDVCGKHKIMDIGEAFGVRSVDFNGGNVMDKLEVMRIADKLGVEIKSTDTIDDVEKKVDLVKSVLTRKIKVTTQAIAIDIFDAFSIHEDVEYSSEFPWIRLNEKHYAMSCFDEGVAELKQDDLGVWNYIYPGMNATRPPGKGDVFKWADKNLKASLPKYTMMAKRRGAKWMHVPASDKMVKYVQRILGSTIIPPGISKGDCSNLIDRVQLYKQFYGKELNGA